MIYEILALKKPNILIPLPKKASRGDQLLNAESFSSQGFSVVLPQEELEENPAVLLRCLEELHENKDKYKKEGENLPLYSQVVKIKNQVFQFLAEIKSPFHHLWSTIRESFCQD